MTTDTNQPLKVIIMGAAGRDFHNFNVYFRDNKNYRVVAFTASHQIPDIDDKLYPPVLAGELYPEGIPIKSDQVLPELIREHGVDQVILAYSDLAHRDVMYQASLVLACGADFRLMGPKTTMLESKIPVISVCAVRTGSGKSALTRRVCEILINKGRKVIAIRHPMPYGDLAKQTWQRYETYDDLDKHECTIEEREEYEPHIEHGVIVYAGVDYQEILDRVEAEAPDVIIWDGGNNDIPFYKPKLSLVLADPHRPGHEISYYPGETNLRMADVVIINKMDTADPENIEKVRTSIAMRNPTARIVEGTLPITVDHSEQLKGKKVLVVEDGPTLTHGNMAYGAGTIAAKKYGAAEIVSPRFCAVGSIQDVFDQYVQVKDVLPAMGYSEEQINSLQATINACECDLVVVATPVDLGRLITVDKPVVRVEYEFRERKEGELEEVLKDF